MQHRCLSGVNLCCGMGFGQRLFAWHSAVDKAANAYGPMACCQFVAVMARGLVWMVLYDHQLM